MKIFKIILLVAIVALILSGFFSLYNRLTGSFIEKSAPEITALELPRGLGLLPVQVRWLVKDRGAGLGGVSIRLLARNKSKEIFKRSFNGETTAEIQLDVSRENYPELLNGQIELLVKAFDRSYFSNSSEQSFPLLVDLKKPQITPLTLQHNVYKGNIELVMWRAKDDNMHVSGIKDSARLYVGYPAKSIDTTFKGNDTYIGFFLADPFLERTDSTLFLSAEDLAGNSSVSNFTYKILDRKFTPIKIKTKENLINKLAALTESGKERIEAWQATTKKPQEDATLFEKFKILEKLDRLDLQSIVNSGSSGKLWQGPFYPLFGTVLNTYGSNTSYYAADNNLLGERMGLGYEMRTNNLQTIFSQNSGKVIYAGDLGIFGNSVIIDYGLGLTSLYGFMSKVLVNKGDLLKNGAAIGISGESGFAAEHGYYLEFMLQGVAFDPRGLWDQKWYEDHINKKIISVKRNLGLPVFSNSY